MNMAMKTKYTNSSTNLIRGRNGKKRIWGICTMAFPASIAMPMATPSEERDKVKERPKAMRYTLTQLTKVKKEKTINAGILRYVPSYRGYFCVSLFVMLVIYAVSLLGFIV